ncbi:unnamed protein product [Rotaria sp. Silwood1]|nr:unnamed protein product [Rotaria sp. Silwood1]
MKKDRVGGRTLAADLKTSHDGNETDRFDLGGQWLESLVSNVPTWDPMMTRNADYLDQHTLADLMKPWIRNSGYATPLLTASVRTVFGCEPEQVNALFALTYTQAGGGFMRLSLTDPDCAQEKKIKGGSQQISQLLVERLGTVLVTTSQNHKTFQCRKLILTIPPSQIIPIQFKPMLPGYKREMLKHMPIGCCIKFISIFDKAFWREDGLSGEVISDGSFAPHAHSIGPMTYLIDGTSSNGTPALLGFIGGRCASVWTSATYEERRKGLIECLSRYFGEPYSGGCPCHNATTGSMKDFVDGLRKSYKMIHFAGTETATQWMGYMDGAVDAGRRAASEVLVSFRDNNQLKDNDIDQYTFENQNRKYQNVRVPRSKFYYVIPIIVVSIAAICKMLFPKML